VPVGVVTELVEGDVYHWGSLMAGALLGLAAGRDHVLVLRRVLRRRDDGSGEGVGDEGLLRRARDSARSGPGVVKVAYEGRMKKAGPTRGRRARRRGARAQGGVRDPVQSGQARGFRCEPHGRSTRSSPAPAPNAAPRDRRRRGRSRGARGRYFRWSARKPKRATQIEKERAAERQKAPVRRTRRSATRPASARRQKAGRSRSARPRCRVSTTPSDRSSARRARRNPRAATRP
jgi:hypothetical protein